MNEPIPSAALNPSVDGSNDAAQAIAALRMRGAHRWDPVRFCFIEALARRAGAHDGEVRRVLEGKLAQALAAYGEQHEKAGAGAADAARLTAEKFPQAADEACRLCSDGDFRALRRLAAQLETSTQRGRLADLVSRLDGPPSADARRGPAAADAVPSPAGAAAELKALRHFRSTWARLSVDQQLTRSLAKAPENAGPLNSHRLVLRSLQLLRDIAPDYLHRFMSSIETLLWLDQASGGSAALPGKTARGDSEKKPRKSGRGR